MTQVRDAEGNKIGRFDGRFVRDKSGKKIYLIDEQDVFSVPAADSEYKLGSRASIKIADLVHKAAIDSEGVTIFTL